MIYVGNDEDSRAYRLYDPETKKVYSRRYADVLFDERPKKRDATPTESTESLSDVQLFDEDVSDQPATTDVGNQHSASFEDSSASQRLSLHVRKYDKDHTLPALCGKMAPAKEKGPAPVSEPPKKGPSPPAASKKGADLGPWCGPGLCVDVPRRNQSKKSIGGGARCMRASGPVGEHS